MQTLLIIAGVVVLATIGISILLSLLFRVVVPTNMVHIVQTSKSTTAYGRGKESGNTYYKWPSFVPFIGVDVTEFPESIFQINLNDYDAYDEARLPFIVDVSAFFRVSDAATAAQRVSSFSELRAQLTSVVQGSVRRILATNKLEDIMQDRSVFGSQFTQEVESQVSQWGVIPVKTIEFMDIRDSRDSAVIRNIMEKEKSRIERDSRIEVADNKRDAQLRELDAQRTVDIQQQENELLVGIKTAEKDQRVGIAHEQSTQEVKAQALITAERDMAIQQVQEVRAAEIRREVAIVDAEERARVAIVTAEAEKQTTVVVAEGQLEQARREAEATQVRGAAAAEAEKLMLMAPVTTQIALAQEIGANEGYQQYLVSIEQIRANSTVGVEMAKALETADMKIIANSGNAPSGIKSLIDVVSPAGGTAVGGMLDALQNTDVGKAIVSKLAQ